MKKIGNVLKFELGNYFGSKSFVISTIIISLVCAIIMFVPRIIDSVKGNDTEQAEEIDEEDKDVYAYFDAQGIVDTKLLAQVYPDVTLKKCESVDEVKDMVEKEEAVVGYVLNSITDYEYYVFNKGMYDDYTASFNAYLVMLVKQQFCEVHNLDFNTFMGLDNVPVTSHENVLGKDSTQNYWYCYILVIVVFMIIVMYGTTIASSVANEKGNRSMEILVTSTEPSALLFGKVFAGAIATLFQVGLIVSCLLVSYQFNKKYWGSFGAFFDIPGEVLVAFAVFGLGGFLIYAFLYGALGALVSKIEDLNKTAGTAQMIVTIVYMIILINLTNVDGIIIKVCSFLPISSYSAMFARVAMGEVAAWEIVLSAVILYASVIGMGFVGGKIFRNSTLRYGNPIKISNALKELRKADK